MHGSLSGEQADIAYFHAGCSLPGLLTVSAGRSNSVADPATHGSSHEALAGLVGWVAGTLGPARETWRKVPEEG